MITDGKPIKISLLIDHTNYNSVQFYLILFDHRHLWQKKNISKLLRDWLRSTKYNSRQFIDRNQYIQTCVYFTLFIKGIISIRLLT